MNSNCFIFMYCFFCFWIRLHIFQWLSLQWKVSSNISNFSKYKYSRPTLCVGKTLETNTNKNGLQRWQVNEQWQQPTRTTSNRIRSSFEPKTNQQRFAKSIEPTTTHSSKSLMNAHHLTTKQKQNESAQRKTKINNACQSMRKKNTQKRNLSK